MRVKNDWTRPIRVGRQIIARGHVVTIADDLLLQPRVQKLRKSGKLIFPYVEETKKEEQETPTYEAVPEADVPMEKDNLADLTHIGAGRTKILNTFGIFTFADVVKHAGDLHEILEITETAAEEVLTDAEARVG